MKLIKKNLAKFLFVALIVAGFPLGGHAAAPRPVEPTPASSPIPPNTEGTITIVSSVSFRPMTAGTVELSCASLPASTSANFIQNTAPVNLNQAVSCFSLGLGSATPQASLTLGAPAVNPAIVLQRSSAEPLYQFNATTALPLSVPVGVLAAAALMIIVASGSRRTKRGISPAPRALAIMESFTLSQLQVFRC